MTRISDIARITVEGLDSKVDHDSPLEDQVRLVYTAALRFAQTQKFRQVHYLNQYPGYEGPLIMKRLVQDLFPHASRDKADLLSGQINQVLRRTTAAICTRRPRDGSDGLPEWFIRAELPEGLGSAAASVHMRRIAGADRLGEAARRLTSHEAGEDRAPAPVVVKFTEPHTNRKEPAVETTTAPVVDQQALDEKLDREIFEHIATSPQPVTITELTELLGEVARWQVNTSVKRLERAGKILGRVETREEGAVRVGGTGRPMAKPPNLWWPTPGPVPIRTALPPGVTPQLSGQARANLRREEHGRDANTLLRFLKSAGPNQHSTGKISEATGFPIERVRDILNELVSQEKVRRTTGALYYHTEARRNARPAATPPPPAAPEALWDGATAAIQDLVTQLATSMTRELVSANQELRDRITELEAELEKKKAALRAML